MITYREYISPGHGAVQHIGYEIRRLLEGSGHLKHTLIDEKNGDVYVVDHTRGWIDVTKNGVGLKTLELARIGALDLVKGYKTGIAYHPSDLMGKTIEEVGIEIDQYRRG